MMASGSARVFTRCTILLIALLSSGVVLAAVGRTPGTFSVSPTGNAQYTVPVWTPPGAGGMQPDLSIFYSHNKSNGILGMGWDISGFSAITRCPRILYFDNVDAGVTMTSDDVFCLDGQRINAISGTYGAGGSEYRTVLESFSRIRAFSGGACGPIWFEVYQRNGLIYQYGNSTTSCIDFGGATAKEWALSSIRDRAGNTITFKYEEDNSNGTYRPDEITYATNTTAGVSTAPYRIKFFYEVAARPDPIYGFWPAGGARNEPKRLEKIEVQYGSSPKKMYLFGYTPSTTTGLSRLTSLQECSTSISDCLTATALTWTTANAGLQAEQNPSQTTYGVHLIDISGDGRDDMVYSSSSGAGTWRFRTANTSGGFNAEVNTTLPNTNFSSAQPIQWDGDRFMDLLVPYSGGNWYVFRSNGSGFDTPINTGISYSGVYQPMDINGDGKDDLVRASDSGAATLYVRYKGATNFGAEETLWSTGDPNFSFFNAFPLSNARYRSAQRRADFNGDGKEDFVCWLTQHDPEWGTTWTAIARCYAGGYDVIEWSDGSTDLGGSHMYGDLNDDGFSDIVWATNSQFKLIYGGSSTIVFGPSSASLYLYSMGVGDYDGDGRDDVLAQSTVSPYSLQFLRSTGNGLAAKQTTTLSYPASSSFKLAELNGDGRMDVLTGDWGALKYRLHEPPLDLLNSATDGFGVAATFTYAPMPDPTVYTVGSGAPSLTYDVVYARPIVKQVTATDLSGNNSTYTLTYTYQAARADTLGMGFLGFEKRKVVDSRTNMTVEETYLQVYPHTGHLKSGVLKQSNGNVVRQTTNDWWMLPLSPGTRMYPYVWKTETIDKELNNTHYRTTTRLLPGTNGANGIDATWGLVTNVTTTTVEIATGDWSGESKTEQLTHSLHVDSPNWCVRPATTHFINDISISGIPSQTRTFERTWDPDGTYCRVTQERIEPGNTSLEVDTDYEFDLFGNIKKETVTGAGMTPRVSQTNWGSAGQFPVTLTNAAGHVTANNYDYGLAMLTSVTDPNSEPGTPIVSTWTYDAFARPQTRSAPDGTDTRYDYVSCMTSDSRVKYAIDVKQRKTDDAVIRTDNFCFDRYDRPLLSHKQLPDGGTTYIYSLEKAEFDPLGRMSRKDNPSAWGGSVTGYWSYAYDILSRLSTESLYTAAGSLNRDQTYAYNGLTTTGQDFKDNTTTRVVTGWNDLAHITDAASGATTYTFDAFGQVTKVTDPMTNIISQVTYNVRGMKETSTDIDMGTWTFKHNALGELVAIRDAKTSSPNWTMEFTSIDPLGRPVTRVEAEGTTTFTYGGSATDNNIGMLASVSAPGISESFEYDAKARLSGRNITISGDATYEIDYTYDSLTGMLDTLTYPQSTSSYRFKLQYEYAFGALTKVKRFDSPYTAYWTLDGIDPRGNVQLQTLGNGVGTESTYDPLTGFLTNRVSNSGSLQNLEYQWDLNGNLQHRKDYRLSLTETFTYDALDRVTGSTLTGVGTNLSVGYNAIGNITTKDGASYDYTTAQAGCSYYSHSQRHAVRKVGTTVYCYDANGNMISRGGATITWTSFNMPSSIGSGTPSSQFLYGPDRQRFKQIGNYTGGTETTFYVGSQLEKLVTATRTHYKHLIQAPTGLVATYTRRSDATEETLYFTQDHLNSVDTITSSGGAVTVRLSYDAFGARRDEADWNGAPPSGDWTSIANTGRRGYTAHEHLDNLGLIHMKGRVQDPVLGRFISADPYVPDPASSQSYNRYSYVRNNPLSRTDPSGFYDDGVNGPTWTWNGDIVSGPPAAWNVVEGGPLMPTIGAEGAGGFSTGSGLAPNPAREEPGPTRSSVQADRNAPSPDARRRSVVLILSIDDGPQPAAVLRRILEILRKRQIRAEFFLVGNTVTKELVKEIEAGGHTIENHSWDHRDNDPKTDPGEKLYSELNEDEVRQQMKDTQDAITNAGGKAPTKYRPPGGADNPHHDKVSKELGLKVVRWKVDTNDWRSPVGLDSKMPNILGQLSRLPPGTHDVLMHVRSGTANDLNGFIDTVLKDGYTIGGPD